MKDERLPCLLWAEKPGPVSSRCYWKEPSTSHELTHSRRVPGAGHTDRIRQAARRLSEARFLTAPLCPVAQV
jgi:hypothetical protein